MNYLESLSLASYILGALFVFMGIFLPVYLAAQGFFFDTSVTYFAGIVLWLFFWGLAFGFRMREKEKLANMKYITFLPGMHICRVQK